MIAVKLKYQYNGVKKVDRLRYYHAESAQPPLDAKKSFRKIPLIIQFWPAI
jgi:hypothetical protein